MLNGATRQICIRFPNGEYSDITSGIIAGSASLERVLCSSTDLNFGECNASKFEIQISDIENISGVKIQVYVKVPGYEQEESIFTGYVDSAEKNPEINTRKIIAYDELKNHSSDDVSEWYNNFFSSSIKSEYLGEWSESTKYMSPQVVKYEGQYYRYLCNSSDKFQITIDYDDNGSEITEDYIAADYMTGMTPDEILLDVNASKYIQYLDVYNEKIYGSDTIKNFRDSLFAYVGIEQEDTVLVNDSVAITKTIDSNEIKFSDCIKAICQINAVFGHMSAEGIFQYVSLGGTEVDFSGNYKATSTTYEEFTVKSIDSVRLYDNAGNVTSIYGAGTNYWNINNNFLIYNLASDVLDNIASKLYAAVSEISYTPVSVQALISLFLVDIGGTVKFVTHDDVQVSSYVLKDKIYGAQLTNQTISATGNESRQNGLSVADTLSLLNSKTNAIVEQVYEKIIADSAEIKSISGDLANYQVVVAGTIRAINAEIENVKAISITTENLEAKVAALGYATIEQLDATNANVETIIGDFASFKEGEFETLKSQYAAFETTMTQELITAKGWMLEGAIGDAQISSVAANKLTAGTIDTAIVTIAGTDGRLQISDNTIQISDGSTVRVQIGKDASDDYSMSVWDASGNLIWDALGATENTIQRPIIRDSMVSDDAAIQALKIDFQSFEAALTDQGVVISGTVVQVGDKYLNVVLSEQTQLISEHGETLSDHAAQISANEQAIELRVTSQVYESDKAAMESSLQTVEAAVEVMEGKIDLKVEQTDIDASIKKMKIGARNLIRNAKTLIFEDYYFADTNTYLTDENGDRLLDENGDYLIA